MANVFKQAAEPNNKVETSHFDLSFQNNLTMQFGYLYPCFVKKFAPKTSVKIKPTFGLNFMPMMFPVQTRMRARMSFYKVRCRSLWKDYKDWFGNLKPNLEKPYIDFNTQEKLNKMASTGSLGDYLGLPTSLASNVFSEVDATPYTYRHTSPLKGRTIGFLPSGSVNTDNSSEPDSFSVPFSTEAADEFYKHYTTYKTNSSTGQPSLVMLVNANSSLSPFYDKLVCSITVDLSAADHFLSEAEKSGATLPESSFSIFSSEDIESIKTVLSNVSIGKMTSQTNYSVRLRLPKDYVSVDISTKGSQVVITWTIKTVLSDPDEKYFIALPSLIGHVVDGNNQLSLRFLGRSDKYARYVSLGYLLRATYGNLPTNYEPYFDTYVMTGEVTRNISSSPYPAISAISFEGKYRYDTSDLGSIDDLTLSTSPYYNSASSRRLEQLKIDASFFRAYESIYNAYFRDIRNNPYILNGQPEYNIFIPSDEGGADNNIYELRRRNWEADFLTTAVPSPQQGRAPLVGITTYNDSTNLAFTAEDGKKYAVTFDYDKDAGELKDVAFRELGDDAIIREARNMMDLVSSGISISDLRNVNAYTKFLELNMRKGYFYKDLVEGHFDTKVRYDELNMPEFIGGTAKDVFVNPVSQTVQTSSDGSYFGALGSYAGQASVSGQADNTISAYFDEETIVIGLISIVPVANYSQLLPKHFLHRELLDSYFPEFDNIGFQPILYNEVCPIQAFNSDPKSLSETFGYQRPWYDYVASVDEVHGLFRTNLRNFLINRVFASKPTLSEDFLLVDPEQVNDVFSVTQTTDKILGQVWFDVQVKAPISRIAIPRLD